MGPSFSKNSLVWKGVVHQIQNSVIVYLTHCQWTEWNSINCLARSCNSVLLHQQCFLGCSGKFNSRGDLLRLPAPLILLTDQWWAIPVIISFSNAMVTKRHEAKPYHVIFTLSLQAFKHHGFAAAAGEWPWRTDEHPDEGVCQGGAQALCQAEKVWGLATADICSSLVAQQRWWTDMHTRDHRCHLMY